MDCNSQWTHFGIFYNLVLLINFFYSTREILLVNKRLYHGFFDSLCIYVIKCETNFQNMIKLLAFNPLGNSLCKLTKTPKKIIMLCQIFINFNAINKEMKRGLFTKVDKQFYNIQFSTGNIHKERPFLRVLETYLPNLL